MSQNPEIANSIRTGEFNSNVHDVGTGGGLPVMLIHGSGPGVSAWANWRQAIPALARDRRVIAPDMVGFGYTDRPAGIQYSMDTWVRQGLDLLDALGLEKVHLVGNSFGGHSAVAFALAHPARVGKLVLMGGGTGGPSQFVPMPTEGIKLLQGLYRDPTIENLKKMMAVFVFDTSSLTEALYQARLDNMMSRKDHLENFVKSLAANPKQFPDYGPRLGEITAPTLVIWGRDDRFVPMDVGLRLLWGMPNAELHIFNRCGHWAQWEHADKFNRMVLDFLGN